MPTEVNREEQIKASSWWREHIDSLKSRNLVTDNGHQSVLLFTCNPENIGYDQGQIRPGELGQWDIFYELEMFGIPYAERILLSGLSDIQVQAEDKKMKMENLGYNSDDPTEVLEFERHGRMTPDELDREITELRSLLAETRQ